MRNYQVPIQFRQETKPFGGVLSLRQFFYITFGFGLGCMFCYPIPWDIAWIIPKAILFLLPIGLSIPPGFKRIEKYDWYLDRYLLLKWHFYVSRKEFSWRKKAGGE
ncbi:MAG: hypothetical protein FH756_00215 [Firmicutes bacterium]|nr:hypothetical protein [Bacillota bacterium]